MVGIVSYGAYIPLWRMERDKIAAAEGMWSLGGERAEAARDEDSLTMGVEAARDCLKGQDPRSVDGLYFATVTPPYREKLSSSIIAAALDMRSDVTTFDFTASTRAGVSAVKAACDSIKSGSAGKILVIASDMRRALPRSEQIQNSGDGAAALLLGTGNVIASIDGYAAVSNPLIGTWQRQEDAYPKSFEPKLDKLYGVLKDIPAAIANLLSACGVPADTIAKYALYAADPRSYRDLAKALAIDPARQLQDALFFTIGITGTPHCLLLLVGALETAGANERIVCCGYGEGAEAILITTAAAVAAERNKHKGTTYALSGRKIPFYGQFTDWQKTRDAGWPPKGLTASLVQYWRDAKWYLPLYGMRCNKCMTLQYPISRLCMMCGEKDNHEKVKIAGTGKVFTYTHDYLMGPGMIPGDGINPVTRTIVDMDDGCRLWMEMCDSVPDEVDIGMTVETAFRLLHEKSDYRYYGWRVRPART